MKPEGVLEEDWREYDCPGCKKHIEGRYDKFIHDEPYNQWAFISEINKHLCPSCYPIYQRLVTIIIKAIKKDFIEARAEMTWRMNDNFKKYSYRW